MPVVPAFFICFSGFNFQVCVTESVCIKSETNFLLPTIASPFRRYSNCFPRWHDISNAPLRIYPFTKKNTL